MFSQFVKVFKAPENIDKIIAWESKSLSEECIKLSATSGNSLNARINYFGIAKIPVKFSGNYLNQIKVTFTHKNIKIFFILILCL